MNHKIDLRHLKIKGKEWVNCELFFFWPELSEYFFLRETKKKIFEW